MNPAKTNGELSDEIRQQILQVFDLHNRPRLEALVFIELVPGLVWDSQNESDRVRRFRQLRGATQIKIKQREIKRAFADVERAMKILRRAAPRVESQLNVDKPLDEKTKKLGGRPFVDGHVAPKSALRQLAIVQDRLGMRMAWTYMMVLRFPRGKPSDKGRRRLLESIALWLFSTGLRPTTTQDGLYVGICRALLPGGRTTIRHADLKFAVDSAARRLLQGW